MKRTRTLITKCIIAAATIFAILTLTGCDEEDKNKMQNVIQTESSIGAKYLNSQKNKASKPEEAKSADPDGPSTNGLGISDEKYEASIKKSLVSFPVVYRTLDSPMDPPDFPFFRLPELTE